MSDLLRQTFCKPPQRCSGELLGLRPVLLLQLYPLPPLLQTVWLVFSLQADGKVVDGLLGDPNGVEPAPSREKDSGKWQKPRFSRKALMRCCLVKWIIASTQPQEKGEEPLPALPEVGLLDGSIDSND